MGFLARLFGTDEAPHKRTASATARAEMEVERYRHLVRTAPSETLEQAHAEAFGRLSDEQRNGIYERLTRGGQTGERPLSSEPATLARAAARQEFRVPGTLERALRGDHPGIGIGAAAPGSALAVVAPHVLDSALVSAFLPWDPQAPWEIARASAAAERPDRAYTRSDGRGRSNRDADLKL